MEEGCEIREGRGQGSRKWNRKDLVKWRGAVYYVDGGDVCDF